MNTKSRIKIRLLKDYFRKRPEVSMAFVFGSYAKKRQIKESKDAADKLAQFAKLRNILAHEYLDTRFTHIKRFIEASETAYKNLLDFVKALLT